MTTATETIDRQSPVPFYQQLSGVLEQRITTGRIEAGARLQSENELCTEFGLSRATVRQALQLLESRGFAQRVAGRGVFAREPASEPGWLIQGKEGFLENAMGHQNRSVTTRVLQSGFAVLPSYACRCLEVPEGTNGFELIRLRYLDDVPALYSTNYSPPELAPVIAGADEVLDGRASLSELLTGAGYPLGGAHRTIRALTPPRDIADALEIQDTDPVLCIRSTSWTPDGKLFDVYETWVRSDIVPIEVNVSTVDLSSSRR